MFAGNDVIIFSDGGASGGEIAGSACIVEDPGAQSRFKFTARLGKATNNEAEIVASLIGFSFLSILDSPPTSVRWVCDSEYVLKSATQYIVNWQRNGWKTASKKPVKNQGLWRAYLHLSQGLKITPEHVFGHTGHPENEACDTACNWVRLEGSELIDMAGAGKVTEIDDGLDNGGWLLLDGIPFIECMRTLNPEQDAIESIASQLRELGYDSPS